jgi:hypothetical protein
LSNNCKCRQRSCLPSVTAWRSEALHRAMELMHSDCKIIQLVIMLELRKCYCNFLNYEGNVQWIKLHESEIREGGRIHLL